MIPVMSMSVVRSAPEETYISVVQAQVELDVWQNTISKLK